MRTIFLVVFLSICLPVLANSLPTKQDLVWAEKLFLMSKIRSASPVVKVACFKNNILCRDTDQSELVISFIGSQQTKNTKLSLVSLMRFKLDGSAGETHQCYILDGGKEMSKLLKNFSIEKLETQCKNEFDLISRKDGYGKVDSDLICATREEILTRRKLYMSAIKEGRKCSEVD